MSTVLQSEWLTNEASYVLSYQASGLMHLFFVSSAGSMQDQACSIRVLPEMTINNYWTRLSKIQRRADQLFAEAKG